ncbi:MAG: Nif3-like dinuclear metal center hexameric protein [Cytophagaceae bacterium]
MTQIKDIIAVLENFAPSAYREDYDNTGLLTGDADQQVSGILITLDTTEEVVEEAIKNRCNLIISHHPVIFRGLKKLTGSNYVERTVIKAIQNNVAIFATHTNLDNVSKGVNFKIAEKLGLKNIRILAPKKHLLKKMVTFIPVNDTERVMQGLYKAGGGNIGNYSNCSFQLQGTGTFKPDEEANPTIGQPGKQEYVTETRAEVIFPSYLENQIIKALRTHHPYEVPAFDINLLENENPEIGSGVIAEPEQIKEIGSFLREVKEKLNIPLIRHTRFLPQKVEKVAICGGSGSFLLPQAIKNGCQVFISSDFKYHEFFDAENKTVIADIGHYEGEVFTKELISDILRKKFSNIALVLSNINTNPISYL